MRRRERLPQVQRVAAYAVILRDDRILLSRLADALSPTPVWTLPGGGLDHGEDPRSAVVREVREETGLDVTVGETAWLLSAHRSNTWRRGRNVDAHALRIVYDGWVPVDAPPPHTVEVGGSTAEAAWHSLADVRSGAVATLSLVAEALDQHQVTRVQRVATYGLLTRAGDGAGGGVEVLLTRIAPHAVSGGKWHLPGGGIDFGESPSDALLREFVEETGLKVEIEAPLEIRDLHFTGVAPTGRLEDFHGIQLAYRVRMLDPTATPEITEVDGTTDQVRWVPLGEVEALETTTIVGAALAAAGLAAGGSAADGPPAH